MQGPTLTFPKRKEKRKCFESLTERTGPVEVEKSNFIELLLISAGKFYVPGFSFAILTPLMFPGSKSR